VGCLWSDIIESNQKKALRIILLEILYLKFKVSNQKAKFVPREHLSLSWEFIIESRLTSSYLTQRVIWSYHTLCSRKPRAEITQTRWMTKYTKEWWIIKFSNFKESYFLNYEANLEMLSSIFQTICDPKQTLALIKNKMRPSFIFSTWMLWILGRIYHL
jgi:hypothetical protein